MYSFQALVIILPWIFTLQGGIGLTVQSFLSTKRPVLELGDFVAHYLPFWLIKVLFVMKGICIRTTLYFRIN